MTVRSSRLLTWCATFACGIAVVLVASAAVAAPLSSPETITAYGFESGADSFPTNVPLGNFVPGETTTSAYWGSVAGTAASGSRFFWCAGLSWPGNAPRAYSTPYPGGSRGIASVRLAQLAGYYSSFAKLSYRMPSIGAEDTFKLTWNTYDGAGNFLKGAEYTTFDPTAAWTPLTVDMSTVSTDLRLSRQAADVGLFFNDHDESPLQTTNGYGPSVDDFVVLGYKYGPVRSVTVTSNVEGQIDLTWPVPYSAVGSSSNDTRTISYRVWRAPAGTEVWEELTAGGRAAANSWSDLTGVPGLAYDYVVQAWDPATGDGRGQQSPAGAWRPSQATQLTVPSGPATRLSTDPPFMSTGTLLPAHAPGASVQIQCSLNGTSNITTTIPAPIQGNGTTYQGSVSLTQPGTWYIRARHADTLHLATFSGWHQVVVSLPAGAAWLSAPSARTVEIDTSFTSTGTLLPQHSQGATVGIECRKSGADITQRVTATVGPDGTTYSGSLSFDSAGTWEIRARHEDALHSETFSEWRSFTVSPALPYATVGAPRKPSGKVYTWAAFATTGTIEPAHSGVATVAIQCSQNKSTIHSTYTASTTSGGTTYSSASVKLPHSGTWYIRARHQDATHRTSYSTWTTVTVTSAVVLTAPKPRTTMRVNRTYSVAATVKPRHTSGKYLKIRAYKWSSRKRAYVYIKSFSVTVSSSGQPANTTKCTARVKLTSRGTWKLKLAHSAHGVEGKTYSSYSSKIRVK